MTLAFRDATHAEYLDFRAAATADYLEQMTAFGGFDEGTAQAKADHDLQTLLPETGPAPGHRLTLAFEGGEQVGVVWVGPQAGGRSGPWVFDVHVDPARRGQGIGRALMEQAERLAREDGETRLGLNVFGSNAVAIALYESLGYVVESQQMSKALDQEVLPNSS